jgi:PAS domain S-box-containing protein
MESAAASLTGLEQLFDTLGVGVVLEDAEAGVVAWNPAAEQLLAMSGEQIRRAAPPDPGWALLHEDGWPLPGESLPPRIALRTGRACLAASVGVKHPSGAVTWLSVDAHPLFRDGERRPYAVATSMRDVTAVRAERQDEQRSADRFRSLIEYSADVISILDGHGRVSYESPSVERVLGYAPGEADNAARLALIHPDDLGNALEAVRGLYGRPGASAAYEYRIRARSGSWRIFESVATNRLHDPAVTGIVINSRDITERRETEAALRATSSRLTNLVENLQAGVLVEDERRRIAVVNAELCAIFEIDAPPEALLGADCAEAAAGVARLFAEPDRFAARIEELIEARRPVRGEEIAFADGRTFERDYIPVSADLDDRGHLWLYRDISLRKEREREAARMRDEAIRSSREKSDFLATMSHEIRTPMNGVVGAIELLLDTPLDEGQRDLARLVRESAFGLTAIIDDVLDLSKIEAAKLEPKEVELELADVAEGVADVVLGSARPKGLALSVYVDPSIPARLRGDPQWLRQVLVNLAGNAVKFTARGEVRIGARLEGITAGVATVRFSVADTGSGIPEAARRRVFEPFAQLDPPDGGRQGGTGLGLAICQRLVGLMGGEIDVASTPGEGSELSFSLRLPVADAQPPAPSAPDLRVLVAEASGATALVARDYVAGFGMGVERAGSAVEALRLATQAERPFDVAIIGTGLEWPASALAAQLRALPGFERLDLVLLRDAGERSDEQPAAGLFDRELTKPLKRAQLLKAVTGSAPEARPLAAEEEPARSLPRGTRVLIADDDDVSRELLVRRLAHLGVHADAVRTGTEAVDALGRSAYDAVLMDLQMPEVGGVDAARAIRALPGKRGATPIVAVTAGAERDAGADAGMDAFLAKPVTARALEQVLARCLAPPTHVDAAALDRLADELGDRRELDRIVALYLEQMPERVASISAASEAGDADAVRFAAHRLGSASAVFGAARLAELCARLEKGDAAPADELAREAELVTGELRRLIGR